MIVVDCAALVDALLGVGGTDDLRSRLEREELHAPSLLDYEVVSALRGLVLRGDISLSRALDALTDFDALQIERWPSSDALRRRAFDLHENTTAYDAAYAALAEALGAPLVTRDKKLAAAVAQRVRVEVL